MKVLVTGAAGFVGSAFLRYVLGKTDYFIRGFARTRDERSRRRLEAALPNRDPARVHVIDGDLLGDISGLCEDIDAVVHFAARTFVDHSIRDAKPFVQSNILGTYRLLEDARRHKVKRYIQVSTDEVYGAILQGAYDENAPINPTNPYSATKAAGDALAISYAHSYGLHTTVTRTENNYGPFQHPQKAFPVFVRHALEGKPLPVYGDGKHVRQWLWVEDHVRAILLLLEKDYPPGEVFHIAGSQELQNLELAQRILRVVSGETTLIELTGDRIKLIPDHEIRPGHDRRYALNCDKIRKLGWEPLVNLKEGISRAVAWYKQNRGWLTS